MKNCRRKLSSHPGLTSGDSSTLRSLGSQYCASLDPAINGVILARPVFKQSVYWDSTP
jgi:hypothetical protein